MTATDIPTNAHATTPSLRVLVACEFSGRVRNAFLAKGCDAYSCDLVSGTPPTHDRHIIGDVTKLLQERWDIVIAHPPCTYLCNSGVCWLYTEKGRLGKMWVAKQFFIACLNANAPMVCVENPIMHGRAAYKLPPPSQRIQPWMFGEPETKRTCLWLKGLPKLIPTHEKPLTIRQTSHSMGPSKYRGYLRSITYQGIANAMAEQWSKL